MSFSESIDLYLSQIKKYKLLTRKEEIDLYKKIQSGCKESKDFFISSNLRWVVAIARKNKNKGIDISDLIQTGNIGLIKAVEKFDVSMGYKFSTYSMWWISHYIKRSIHDHSRIIRLPVPVNREIYRILKIKSKLCLKLGKDNITNRELMENSNLTRSEIKRFDFASSVSFCESIESKNNDEEEKGVNFMETISYDSIDTPENESSEDCEKNVLETLLDFLSDREKNILINRFGLMNKDAMTLEQIGVSEGVSRERIRQLQCNALKKIKRIAKTHKIDWNYL